jgi:hypothetical protein
LEITERDGHLEIAPVATTTKLVDEGDGVTAVANEDTPILTVELVRDTLERVRR